MRYRDGYSPEPPSPMRQTKRQRQGPVELDAVIVCDLVCARPIPKELLVAISQANTTTFIATVRTIEQLIVQERWRHTKRMVLRSAVSVVNLTSVPLDLRYDLPDDGGLPRVDARLTHGGTAHLPLHVAEAGGTLRWRPSLRGLRWSEVDEILRYAD